jgi:hypothetical protein
LVGASIHNNVGAVASSNSITRVCSLMITEAMSSATP